MSLTRKKPLKSGGRLRRNTPESRMCCRCQSEADSGSYCRSCRREYNRARRGVNRHNCLPGATLPQRMDRYTNKAGGCWEWMGAKSRMGYGRVSTPTGGTMQAHRAAYEIAHGPIPDGLHVCHRCDNPPCVNPAHLFLGNDRDNMRDSAAKGRNWQTRKTHCPHGHALSGENLRIGSRGERRCRSCQRAYGRRRMAS